MIILTIFVIAVQIIIGLLPLNAIRKDKTFIKKYKSFITAYILGIVAVIIIEITLISL